MQICTFFEEFSKTSKTQIRNLGPHLALLPFRGPVPTTGCYIQKYWATVFSIFFPWFCSNNNIVCHIVALWITELNLWNLYESLPGETNKTKTGCSTLINRPPFLNIMVKKNDLSAAKKQEIVKCLGIKTLDISQQHKCDHCAVGRFVADSKHTQVCADKGTLMKVYARQIHQIKTAWRPKSSSWTTMRHLMLQGIPLHHWHRHWHHGHRRRETQGVVPILPSSQPLSRTSEFFQ